MDDFLALTPREPDAGALAALNGLTARCGLTLTQEDARALAARREQALRDTGRVEFGGGVLEKLARAFYDSPYLHAAQYADTLAELQDVFYHMKNESRERLGDDELIAALRAVFDTRAGGAAEYLAGLSPEELLRLARGEEL